MPIVGGTPSECFRVYAEHVGPLIARTVTGRYPAKILGPGSRRLLNIQNPEFKHAIPLESSTHGRIYFYLAQELEACQEGQSAFRLRTCAYWYKVFSEDPRTRNEPTFRWEYEATPPPGKYWCRHHFQVGKVMAGRPVMVSLGSGTADMNRLHLPTGFMLMEYVIRFLIADLGVTPPCGDTWPTELKASEDTFFRRFSPKTSKQV